MCRIPGGEQVAGQGVILSDDQLVNVRCGVCLIKTVFFLVRVKFDNSAPRGVNGIKTELQRGRPALTQTIYNSHARMLRCLYVCYVSECVLIFTIIPHRMQVCSSFKRQPALINIPRLRAVRPLNTFVILSEEFRLVHKRRNYNTSTYLGD